MLKIQSGSISTSKFRYLIAALMLFCSTAFTQVQSESSDSSGFFNSKNLSLFAVSGLYIGTIIDSYFIWWRDDRQPFTVMHSDWFNEKGEYGVDKLGHFYTSYLFFKLQKNIFILGGYTNETAEILSGSLTLGMALIIEIGDGYSKYGFDTKDLISNIGGLGYAYLQEKIPVLNNFNFKWSFIPTDGWHFPPRFSKHYDGHIYWLAVNIAGLFPESVGKVWPSFINPAVGYSVGGGGTIREFTAGLDLDIQYFFKSENKYIDFAGKTLNLLHLPMPGIKMYEHRSPELKLLLLN